MPAQPAQKPSPARPVKLEFNNSGSWKLIGHFDAGDSYQSGEVICSAEALLKALHPDVDPDTASPAQLKRVPTLRVSMDTPGDSTRSVLMHWDIRNGWRDAITEEPV